MGGERGGGETTNPLALRQLLLRFANADETVRVAAVSGGGGETGGGCEGTRGSVGCLY